MLGHDPIDRALADLVARGHRARPDLVMSPRRVGSAKACTPATSRSEIGRGHGPLTSAPRWCDGDTHTRRDHRRAARAQRPAARPARASAQAAPRKPSPSRSASRNRACAPPSALVVCSTRARAEPRAPTGRPLPLSDVSQRVLRATPRSAPRPATR
jgi:hypothetical protein